MATTLKLRRGTTAQHSTFTGEEGEVTVDMTKDTVVVHDGATAGGFPLAKESALSSKQDALGFTPANKAGDTFTGDISVTKSGSNAVVGAERTAAATAGKVELISGDNTNALLSYGSKELIVGTNGSEKYRVGASGQLGVGGANYGTAGQVLTSQGASAAPVWGGASGTLIGYQIFTSSGSYDKTVNNPSFVIIEVQAAGGGGAGCASNSSRAGGSGGSGGYGRKKILNASLANPTETVTIGATGLGGAAGNNNGTAGGTSSFGSHVTCTGGGLGTTATNGLGGAGGTVTGADFSIAGQSARDSFFNARFVASGGHSFLGSAGAVVVDGGTVSSLAGQDAIGYGAGGSGALVSSSASSKKGGDGSPAIIIVWEYA